MAPIQCFETDKLNDYLLGNLTDEVAANIEQHLAECLNCEDSVSELDRELDREDDTLVNQLAGVGSLSTELNSAFESPADNSFFQNAKKLIANQHFDFVETESRRETNFSHNIPSSFGDYEIISELARGGMGNVYLAKHTLLNKHVAIKVLSDRRKHRQDSIARFTREMQIIGKMNHPSIVSATDAGQIDGIHFLVMELVDGLDLSRTTQTVGPLNIADACELIRQAAIGLQYAHEQGVTHRDVKPANLMLCVDETVKILDLGLATLNDRNSMGEQLTMEGQLLGTLDYMAPEQCAAQNPADARSDVYGLTATLYKLLTGKTPYSTDNRESAFEKVKALSLREPIPIRDRDPSIPKDLSTIVDQCLSRDPDSRYQTAADLASALVPFANRHDLTALYDAARSRVEDELEPSNDSEIEQEFRIAAAELRSRKVQTKTIKTSKKTHSSFRFVFRFVIALAMLGILGLCSVIIYLQTSTGQLVIESEIDDVQVTVLKDEQAIKDLTINRTEAATRLRIGKYRVIIKGKSDGITIRNDIFEIKRGATVVANISNSQTDDASKLPAPKSTNPNLKRVEVETIKAVLESQRLLKHLEIMKSRLVSKQQETQRQIASLPDDEDFVLLEKEDDGLLKQITKVSNLIHETEAKVDELTGRKPKQNGPIELKHAKNKPVALFLKKLYEQHFEKSLGPLKIRTSEQNQLTLSGSAAATDKIEMITKILDVKPASPQTPQTFRSLFPDNAFLATDPDPKIPYPDFDSLAKAFGHAIPRDHLQEEFDRLNQLVLQSDEDLKTYYPFRDRKTIEFSSASVQHHNLLENWYFKIYQPHQRMFMIPHLRNNLPPLPTKAPKNMQQSGWTVTLQGRHFRNNNEDLAKLQSGRQYLLKNFVAPLLHDEFVTRNGELVSFADFGILYPTTTELLSRRKRTIKRKNYSEEVWEFGFTIEFAWIPRSEGQQLEARRIRLKKEAESQ
jgi:serine/threonine protein kinase